MGVNVYTGEAPMEVELHEYNDASAEKQIASLHAVKSEKETAGKYARALRAGTAVKKRQQRHAFLGGLLQGLCNRWGDDGGFQGRIR